MRLVSALCCCSSRVSKPSDDGDTTPLARMALVFASVIRRTFPLGIMANHSSNGHLAFGCTIVAGLQKHEAELEFSPCLAVQEATSL